MSSINTPETRQRISDAVCDVLTKIPPGSAHTSQLCSLVTGAVYVVLDEASAHLEPVDPTFDPAL